MAESRDVCQICYRSTSHKATPTLTPESKATYDTGVKKKKCSVCRQWWAPIKVTKDSASGKWVGIRARPKIPANIDYQLCKNHQSKIECPKGQECSFAHSKAELAAWNLNRQSEPRPAPPINGPYQYQLCKHMINTGTCPYGQRCTFAHSEEEKRQWLRTQNGRVIIGPGYSIPQTSVPVNTLDTGPWKCDTCGLTCTSAKQLEDHFAGARHRQAVGTKPGVQYQYVPHPPPRIVTQTFRRRPALAFPVHGYRMCMHTQAGRRCVYGDFCTFAHSQLELDEWNKSLQASSNARMVPSINRLQIIQAAPERVPYPQPDEGFPTPVASGLDEFDEEGLPRGDQDFGAIVRDKLLMEHNKKDSLTEFQTTCEGVTVSEVSGRGLCLQWSQATAIDWIFEVNTNSSCTLHSVTLFDSFLTDYDITGAYLVSRGNQQKLPGFGKCDKGAGILLNQKITNPDKVHIKVTLVPRSGLLGQLVVFDFGSFTMIRGLAVHVLTEQESKMLDSASVERRRNRHKPDLFWEQHHHVVPMDQYFEETDNALPEYALPVQIEKFIEGGKYKNVENRVTRDNYKKRMHNLLYLEEYKQREDMARYDLRDIEVTPTTQYTTVMGTMYAPPGHAYLKLSLEETLFEGGKSVRPGDGALLLPSQQSVAHECNVESVAREWVVLKITDRAKQACASAGGRCSVRFSLTRTHMRSMHYAVDHLDLSIIFPEPCDGSIVSDRTSGVMECLKELKRSDLNTHQQEAVTSMLDPACTTIPSLVLGPFGCGKTRTLSECIKLLATLVPESRILICTHSNSAANLYVEGLDKEWRERFKTKAPLFRVYYTGRKLNTIPQTVRQYCNFVNGSLVQPSVQELQSHKIIVATLNTSRALSLAQMPKGHFTHIFIDEAAQALESESIIPLCLAGSRTKIVLAGDHLQMDPPVHSMIARKYGLHVSLLERLYDHEAYESGVGMLCRTLLTENHRSHQLILELPSKLFYKNKLTCKAVFPPTGPRDFPPIKFVGVNGRECQDEESPSYYNEHEVLKIAEQVQLLVSGGLQESDVCVLAYYQLQVQRIRQALRNRRLSKVEVVRVEDVQGKEFRALLLSTVRTCPTEPSADEEAGFLTNPKMFNTAVTRAKQWLVVVGEPFTLCTVGENRLCWMEFIRCCQSLGSFDYTNADQFVEESLDYKIVVRQLLEKAHGSFFSRNKPHTPAHTAPSQFTLTTYTQLGTQRQTEMMRSKVKSAIPNGEELTVRKITDELMKMELDQQFVLLTKPEFFAGKVREIEQVFRRAGPTAAILNSNRMEAPLLSQTATPVGQSASPRPAAPQGTGIPVTMATNQPPQTMPPSSNGGIAGDLPPYLRTSMESVVVYAKWVESILQSPLVASPEIRQNMLRQKANVQEQLRLVNEQIFLYRDVCRLIQPMRPNQPQVSHPMATSTNPMFAPPTTTNALPSQSPYHPFSHSTAGAPPPEQPSMPGNSAFSFGVSALLPNAADPLHSQANQPNFVAGIVKGGRTGNPVSSLDAAISSSAPSHRSNNQQELYESDEELFS